jgi:CRP-like cAMP-binding protein
MLHSTVHRRWATNESGPHHRAVERVLQSQNHLLATFSEVESGVIWPWLEPVVLPRGEVLARPGQSIEHAYFPLSGMVSVVALMSEGLGAEVATVGNEGMIGLPIFLGADSSPFHLMAQLDGEGLRIPAERLATVLEREPRLSTLLRTYSQAFFVQTAQNAACNGLHSVSQRGARWLLATHDRAQSDSFYLTQEFLAFMLGVARQSIGLAVQELQESGMIAYQRGDMRILDRPALEAASCECYNIVRAEFSRLLGIARA